MKGFHTRFFRLPFLLQKVDRTVLRRMTLSGDTKTHSRREWKIGEDGPSEQLVST